MVEGIGRARQDVGVVGVGKRSIAIRPRAIAAEHAEEIPRLSRQRLEQERVDESEHRAVRTNANGEHQHRNRGESGSPGVRAEREAEILEHAGHGRCYGRARGKEVLRAAWGGNPIVKGLQYGH